jgi:fructokinase
LGALIIFEPAGLGDPHRFAAALHIAHVVKYASGRAEKFKALLARYRSRAKGWLLEIETAGANGLRFRAPVAGLGGWADLPAVRTRAIADTAGAGDWCTAVLLDGLARSGVSGLAGINVPWLERRFRLAQAYAALSCEFTGARGLMEQHTATSAAKSVAELVNRAQVATVPAAGGNEDLVHSRRSQSPSRFPFCFACA